MLTEEPTDIIGSMDCPFCKILEGALPSWRVGVAATLFCIPAALARIHRSSARDYQSQPSIGKRLEKRSSDLGDAPVHACPRRSIDWRRL